MAQSLNFFEAWVTSLSYTFQLYFDFSGYTDMALGVGLMFNIVLPRNFNSPYKATSIIDFWRRWHMTLSNFVTTYIYTPILRSFETFSYRKSLFAIFVAMLICGFWHGAGWTFIFWGALQGAALVVNHLWRKRKFKMPRWFGWFLTFNFFNISLVFFRAKDWHNAVNLLKGMVGLNGFLPATLLDTIRARGVFTSKFGDTLLADVGGSNRTLLGLIIVMIFVLVFKNSNELKDGFQPTWKTCAFMVVISFYAFLNMGKVSEFLYFQF